MLFGIRFVPFVYFPRLHSSRTNKRIPHANSRLVPGVAIPASSVFGGPLSGVFLGMDGVGGLAGWKWLFLLEGLPTILLGIIFPWVLTNPAATVLHEIRSD